MKVILFDLGDTLENDNALVEGAKATLSSIKSMQDSNGNHLTLALISDFDKYGWEKCDEIVKERVNRVKLSLEKDNYSGPLVGFIWPSDTAWFGAKFIATANGPKLANLIFELKRYPQTEIRVIAHSLGARVTLSVLDSLLKNQAWSDRNFKISSVHLVGAAVDNEEVSTRPEDILIDETNWSSPKSDYGQAIGEEVIKFSNLFSSKDNMLKPHPELPSLPIYPIFESDFAVGQSGYALHAPATKDNIQKGYIYTRNMLPF